MRYTILVLLALLLALPAAAQDDELEDPFKCSIEQATEATEFIEDHDLVDQFDDFGTRIASITENGTFSAIPRLLKESVEFYNNWREDSVLLPDCTESNRFRDMYTIAMSERVMSISLLHNAVIDFSNDADESAAEWLGLAETLIERNSANIMQFVVWSSVLKVYAE
ncbi:hypothetical protein G4Y79_15370 [Phototrophicus methaneseepsis]|uniref:Uncharacterized protein n=1 Tax=Phototrophicus methaneseepsis TaxID=2710758 RepID=A0A7S8E6B5_9CHLR|nr:hypothetical protein [Phototrophicus methaneseepsis]QPC81083.1 hypothetical protein G4Y79_15370 [Phototrophicus methaneseepsis]